MVCLRSLIVLVIIIPAISGKGVTQWCLHDNKFLFYYSSGSFAYSTLASAKTACLKREDCTGITQEPVNGGRYTLRKDMVLNESPSGEITYVPCGGYFSCDTLGLKSVHGKFLSAQKDGSVEWDKDRYGSWEKIKFEQFGKDTFFLKSYHDKYLAATPRNRLEWNRRKAKGWEFFKVSQYEDKISLKTIHGKYLSARKDGSAGIADASLTWEWFFVHPQECLNNIECDCSKSMDKDSYDLTVEYQVGTDRIRKYWFLIG